MNKDERILVPTIGIKSIGIFRITIPNVFGNTIKEYDIADTNTPYLLMEDKFPFLLEDGSKILIEQQKMRVWRQKARK